MWKSIVDHSQDWAPGLIVVALSILVVGSAHRLMQKRHMSKPNSHLGIIGPVTTFALTGISIVVLILTLPLGDAAKGQLLGLLGLLVTGAIALSSTTILGNALAGIMLRAIRSYGPGDYVRIGEHVGRVSETGILHTEIQTEDRDLTTIPNLYLVSNPLTVLRASGTVISAQVSLGYDVSRLDVETHLIKAANRAGLTDPFVEVVELGDFSITYRAAGFLTEIKHIITTRSNLRKAILDSLHEAHIEIVSPTFVNQRRIGGAESFVPEPKPAPMPKPVADSTPESRIFDKADAAEAKAKILREIETQNEKIAELQAQLGESGFQAEKSQLDEQLVQAQLRLDRLKTLMDEGDQ